MVTTSFFDYSNSRYSSDLQLSGVSPCAPGNTPQHTFSNDAAGNELTFDANTYAYSSRELLASGDGLTYAYDGSRRRVTASLVGTGTRTSVYDDSGLLQAESALTSGAPAYEYIWFGSMPVAQENIGGTTQWTITGRMGEAFLQTTKAGKVAWQADYLPSGKISSLRTPDAHQPLRLPGQEAEELVATAGPNGVSGRYYNGARWYRPDYQRYTQPDPIGFAGSVYSLYAYAHNDPLEYIDPSGLGTIPNPNGVVPGGPWTPEKNTPSEKGTWNGPKQPKGGTTRCQYVPDENHNGPRGAKDPYWKVNQPGEKVWQRYDTSGNEISPEVAHPSEIRPIEEDLPFRGFPEIIELPEILVQFPRF